jgi:hypothetical protein
VKATVKLAVGTTVDLEGTQYEVCEGIKAALGLSSFVLQSTSTPHQGYTIICGQPGALTGLEYVGGGIDTTNVPGKYGPVKVEVVGHGN